MINALVLSKDRACQLRLLLESIDKYASGFFNEIRVIHIGSNDLYKEGYRKLQSENILHNLVWQEEKDFVSDFLGALSSCKSQYICGIVDDCIFYKQIPITWQQAEAAFEDDVFCMSFRLGMNTTMQYYLDHERRYVLEDFVTNAYLVKWNWKNWGSTINYGYPISLDGNIFRTEELSKLSHKYKFKYLRQWEGVLAGKSREDTHRDQMVACRQSVLFSIPSNCVQDPPLIAGQLFPYTEEKLNNMYLGGKVIDFGRMEFAFQNVVWSHNETPLMFKDI